ncbi:MAG: ankyrin repeat domain-containing protein, partial [Proteobacteria bacterium]|nr:ankyrin repeat domain-containing protein [Pseudomonadota bacterium]
MLGLTLREIILCAKSQHPLFTSDIIEAIRNRIKTHPLEVNQQGLFGFTPSHLAVIHNLPVILEALVVDGQADLTIPCQFKQTAVDLAASTPMKAFVGKLADKTQTIVGSIGLHLHELLANRQSFKSDMEFERAVKERVLAH